MPVKGLIETSFIDWPGQVCSVVFLGGCNFRCPFCHNSDLVLRPQTMAEKDIGFVIERLSAFRDWIDGVVITGGEPTLEPSLAQMCRSLLKAGFEVKLDTNGTRPRVVEKLLDQSLLSAVAMDLKAPLADPLLHHRVTGVKADLAVIRQTMDLLLTWPGEVLFRTTAVPGIHTRAVLERMAAEIPGAKKWKLNHFQNKNCLDQAFNDISPLSEEEQAQLQEFVDGLLDQD